MDDDTTTTEPTAPLRYAADQKALRYVPDKVRNATTDTSGHFRPEPVVNAYEFAVIGHMRGWCHDGSICLLCVTGRERDEATHRLNEIIGG